MRQKLPSLLILCIFLISALVFFHKVVFCKRSFLPSLVVAQGVTGSPPASARKELIGDYPYLDAEGAAYIDEPATMFASESYHQLRLPLWNPCVAMGTPLLADMQSAHFFPLRIPLFVKPSPSMWDFFYILRIVVGGIFMFLFCRLWRLSRGASLAAAFIFSYCGYFLLYIHENHLNIDVLIPFVLLFVERLVRDASVRNSLALGVAFGVMQLGGTPPESSFALAFFASVYFLFRVLKISTTGKDLRRAAGYFVLAGLLGLLISLPVTVPFAEFLSHSFHTHHEAGQTYVQPIEFILLFVPFFLGEHNFIMPYVGVVAPVLAVLSFANAGKRKLALFLWGFMLFYLARSFGIHGSNWIGSLPLFRLTFFPKYFHSSFVFCLAVCAAIGFDSVLNRQVKWRALFLSLVPVPAYLVAFYLTYKTAIERVGKTSLALSQFAVAIALIFMLATVLIACRTERLKNLFKAGMLCIVIFGESFFYALPLDYPHRTNPFPEAPYIRFLRQDPSTFRIFSLQGVLPPNYSMVKGLSDIGANNGIFISRYIDLMRAAINPYCGYGRPANVGAPDIHSKMLNLFNVKYLIAKTYLALPASRFALVYDNEVKIYRNLHCLPRAFLVYRWETIHGEPHVLSRMLSDDFDFENSAILEEQLTPPPPRPDLEANSSPQALILNYTPNEVVIKASLPRPGLLVLTDSFFPGWRAEVDGQAAKILRADYLFRAVHLKPGAHTVRFVYRPISFWGPFAIAAATLLCIAIFFCWKAIRRDGAKS